MVLFTACFVLSVWLLQQQTSLPASGWAWLLADLPLALLIPAGPRALLLRSDEDSAILVAMNAHDLQLEQYRRTHRHYCTYFTSH
jgi:hypothetical protein